MPSVRSKAGVGKKQHHYGGSGSGSGSSSGSGLEHEDSNKKMIMSIIGIFCFIVLLWLVYRRGQETCPVSSTSGTTHQ